MRLFLRAVFFGRFHKPCTAVVSRSLLTWPSAGFILAAVISVVFPTSVLAADAVWNVNGNWSTGGSWNPAAAPGATYTNIATFGSIITADSTTPSRLLNIQSPVTGVSTPGNTTTLTLNGSSARTVVPANAANLANAVTGVISDGAGYRHPPRRG